FIFTAMFCIALLVLSLSIPLTRAAVPALTWDHAPPSLTELRYSRAHSLGENYAFNARDGWMNVSTSDLSYKYAYEPGVSASRGIGGRESRSVVKRAADAISNALKAIFKGLKGLGKPQDVVITWYTGHDLQNPSCWANTNWAPTDDSFVCALTMEGWKEKPECFKFLELCNGPKKCVYVRVVDTCAGCAQGSKHVDLTRAAFGQLANFDKGTLNVQMRPATEPDSWYV
ncbi:hypothetical protein K488DRAFT_42087, partial [Vararia minispora EC-137]